MTGELGRSMTRFQWRVRPWMNICFGPAISGDKLERSDRFIEEALELIQASGYTADRAHKLVDYVFNRPAGDIKQEVGGVMVTLAALCLAHEVDMHVLAEVELKRVWTKIDQIRAKQASKPVGSALPIPGLKVGE
jgi:NTP pyrophosphatase (non-canonical NTP hydrolase)